MKEVLEIVKNVKKGPKTTVIGALMMIFGGYLIYETEQSMTYMSVEVGLFLGGVYLFLTSDGLFKSKKDELD